MNYKRKLRRRFFLLMQLRTPPVSSWIPLQNSNGADLHFCHYAYVTSCLGEKKNTTVGVIAGRVAFSQNNSKKEWKPYSCVVAADVFSMELGIRLSFVKTSWCRDGFELRNQIRHCKTVCIKRNLHLINYNSMRTKWTAKGNLYAGSSCSCDRGPHRYLAEYCYGILMALIHTSVTMLTSRHALERKKIPLWGS